MHPVALAFVIINAIALLVLPRKFAAIPLLVSCCYITTGQGIAIGAFNFPVYRIILTVGLARAALRDRFPLPLNVIDALMALWAGWVVFASVFHEWKPGSGPVFASGFVFNIVLVYFLIRTWCRTIDEIVGIARIVAIALIPIAAAMAFERVVQHNPFSMFGGVSEVIYVRDGTIRAEGPFQHPILAGTVGAVCFPLMVGLFRRCRKTAIAGGAACLAIMLTSASSGPMMSLAAGLGAILMWYGRRLIGIVWMASVCAYLFLELAMSRPAYYIISKFDFTGSSTGWHRSRLIQAAIDHLSEWWLFGSDRTIHWMGVSIGWSQQHSDITNYYIWIGVIGGLPAMLLVIAMMWRSFRCVGRMAHATGVPKHDRFMIWCWGSALFAHAITSLSVAYFDQSMIFFWLNLAIISSMWSLAVAGDWATQGISTSHLLSATNDGRVCAGDRLRPVVPAHAIPRRSTWMSHAQ